jgi:hypothetical protein
MCVRTDGLFLPFAGLSAPRRTALASPCLSLPLPLEAFFEQALSAARLHSASSEGGKWCAFPVGPELPALCQGLRARSVSV